MDLEDIAESLYKEELSRDIFFRELGDEMFLGMSLIKTNDDTAEFFQLINTTDGAKLLACILGIAIDEIPAYLYTLGDLQRLEGPVEPEVADGD